MDILKTTNKEEEKKLVSLINKSPYNKGLNL